MATVTWNSISQSQPSSPQLQQRTKLSDAVDRLIERYPHAVEWIKANAILVALLVASVFLPQVAAAL